LGVEGSRIHRRNSRSNKRRRKKRSRSDKRSFLHPDVITLLNLVLQEKQKAQSKQLRDSNKRPDDKKATLRDTYIDLGRGLHMIYAHDLKDVLSEHDAGSNVNEISIPQLSDIRNLVLWRRKVTSKFNEDEKFFEPLLPGEVGIKVVGAYMLYFEPQSLQKLATAKALFQTVVNLQSIVHRIESIRPPHIFVMVNNSTGWNKIKERKRLRRLMEEAYVQLSLEMGVNVIQCEAEEQVVNWIFNLSGDLGEGSILLLANPRSNFDFIRCTRTQTMGTFTSPCRACETQRRRQIPLHSHACSDSGHRATRGECHCAVCTVPR
jgi:hypothetical protein